MYPRTMIACVGIGLFLGNLPYPNVMCPVSAEPLALAEHTVQDQVAQLGGVERRELERREVEKREIEKRELERQAPVGRGLERRELEKRDLEKRELERRELERR